MLLQSVSLCDCSSSFSQRGYNILGCLPCCSLVFHVEVEYRFVLVAVHWCARLVTRNEPEELRAREEGASRVEEAAGRGLVCHAAKTAPHVTVKGERLPG